jgi:hypothetical protein
MSPHYWWRLSVHWPAWLAAERPTHLLLGMTLGAFLLGMIGSQAINGLGAPRVSAPPVGVTRYFVKSDPPTEVVWVIQTDNPGLIDSID